MTLIVTTPATDRTLLTVAERRAAVGVTGASRDTDLQTLEARVAALMARACKIPSSGIHPPTFRVETITETFRPRGWDDVLILSRDPVVSITSLTEADTVLGVDDYENNGGSLRRLSSGNPYVWPYGVVTVVYTAGWATVPEDLKMAATKFMQTEWQQGDRDPLLMSKRIEGVSEYRWWVDPTKDSVIPADVMSILQSGGYVKYWI